MFTLSVETEHYRATVELQNDEPQCIMRGGPLRIYGKSQDFLAAEGRWDDQIGITDCPETIAEKETADGVEWLPHIETQQEYAAMEIALHDQATKEIAVWTVAHHHGLHRMEAVGLLWSLFDEQDVDGFESVTLRPHCLVPWEHPESNYVIAGKSGWFFWCEESAAVVSVRDGVRTHHDGARTIHEAGALARGLLRCQCGEVTGTQCEQFRKRHEMLVVEWMPYEHRASHEAAGNRGEYPGNGALRLLCAADCAALLVENEEGWAHPVGKP